MFGAGGAGPLPLGATGAGGVVALGADGVVTLATFLLASESAGFPLPPKEMVIEFLAALFSYELKWSETITSNTVF